MENLWGKSHFAQNMMYQPTGMVRTGSQIFGAVNVTENRMDITQISPQPQWGVSMTLAKETDLRPILETGQKKKHLPRLQLNLSL